MGRNELRSSGFSDGFFSDGPSHELVSDSRENGLFVVMNWGNTLVMTGESTSAARFTSYVGIGSSGQRFTYIKNNYQPENLVGSHRLERRQCGRRPITNVRRTSCRCCVADCVDFVGEVLCEVRLGVSIGTETQSVVL